MTSTTIETKMQTLRCQHGEGHEWTRPAQRGKPPHFCPEHKGATAKPVMKLSAKVAQAKQEIAEISEEERIKRAEAARKREATREANKAQAEAEERQRVQEELARLNGSISEMFSSYHRALDTALKTNKKEDWHICEREQSRCIGTRRRQAALTFQVNA